MKNFIFYLIKSVQYICFTFSCCFKSALAGFFQTNGFTKKLVSHVTLLLLVFNQSITYGQLVGGPSVQFNMGIDADYYANRLDYGAAVPNTDDWFMNQAFGSGFGVGIIDVDFALHPTPIPGNASPTLAQFISFLQSPAGNNFAFERRQAYPKLSVNLGGDGLPYLWIDGVYGRDNNTGNGSDLSVFVGGDDKNAANPNTWSLGSGSTPPKNDIIDVMAHLRGFGPPANGKPFTRLWAFAGATHRSEDGNSHIDFEFFRNNIQVSGGSFINLGSEGGHRAWHFTGTGAVSIPGDLIFVIDYEKGGNQPLPRIRVWMAQSDVTAAFNSLPSRPFNIVPGSYVSGAGATGYGYVSIDATSAGTHIYAQTNDIDQTTPAAPWGSVGPGADWTGDITQLQFIEFAIDLTAFGLDIKGEGGSVCDNLLGTLLVKTRTSGSADNSFTAQLKDYAGPYLFGDTGTPPVVSIPNKNACESGISLGATVDLTQNATTDGGPIEYFLNSDFTGKINTPTTFAASIGTVTIYARSEKIGNPGCFGSTSFTVTVTDNPDITVQNLTACETGATGAASINLMNGILTNPDAGVITFYNSLADAQNEANAVASPTSVTVASSPRTFWVRAEAGSTNCYSTASFTVSITDNPDITVQNLTACEVGDTGAASVNLMGGILTNPDAGVITFYNSLADAQNEANTVASPTSVTIASSPRTFWVRAEAGTTNCYSTTSFTVSVTDNPDITVQNITACETGATGAASVNLMGGILTNPDAGVITFYNSLADAQNEANAVASPTSVTVASSPRTFWVRAEAGSTNCYSTASFTVSVTDNPDITVQNLTACEIGDTGAASVNLMGGILTNPDAGVITFYNSLADAQNEVNAVASPTSVTVASSPRTFWVRAEAGTTNCYSTASFTVSVTDNPDITVQNLTACETGATGAASVNLMGGILTNPDAGVITFYNSLADAQNEANAVASPTSVTVASSPRTFWVRAEAGSTNCYSTASFTVSITDNPDITVQNLTACEVGDTGAASVALTGAILTNPDAGVITFYNSLSDAQNEVNAVASPTSVTVASSPRTFWVRAEAGTTNCYSTASFTVSVTDNPDITVQNITACETGATGAASVNLMGGILINPDGGIITFYNSLADAQNETNAVASPTSVTVVSSPRTFWVRAEAGSTNCYNTASFTVSVTDNPDITVRSTAVCETGATGAASVNLMDEILTNPDGGVISFYNSFADAQNEVNAVANPASVTVASSPRIFYVRAEAGTTNCYSTASFAVSVTDNPDITVQNITACETGATGAASVNLMSGILTNPDAGVITFYNSLADAQNEVSAVASPASVTVVSSPRTFYVRAESGTTNCYSTSSFAVSVTDNPDITVQNITACETGATGAASVNLMSSILTNPDAGAITFYNSLADAQNEVNAVASPASVTVASSPRTFYVRAEAGTTNCYSTASFTVSVTDNPDITVQNITACEIGNTGAALVALTGAILTNPDAGVITFYNSLADAQNEVNAVASPVSVTIAASPRTFYIRAEAASTNCYSTASFTVRVIDNPDITVRSVAVCENSSTAGALVNLMDEILTNPDGGIITFYNSLADAQNKVNAVSSSTSVTVASSPRIFYARAEAASTNCYSIASFSVTVNPKPELVIHNPQAVCEGAAIDLTAAAITSGSVLGGGSLTYWTNSAATIPLASPNAVTVSGVYYIKVVIGNCMDIKPVSVTIQPCMGPLCTYTQGYYGNPGGMSCAGGEPYTTLGLITKALSSYGGTMIIGSGSNTVSISNPSCVIKVLPGGGGSYVLSGASDICSLPNAYLKKGKINNTLLAQTITLGLNIGINGGLGDYILKPGGTLAIASPQGGCGSDIPKSRSCSAEGYAPTLNEFKYVTIPNVVNYLPNKTVQGLFDMANKALGGEALPQGVTLSALADAADFINNAFDECKIPMGYNQVPLVCDTSDSQGFVAFEVPIVNDHLTVKYKFSYVSDVVIDVFDVTGRKVCTKFDTNSCLNKEVSIDYDFNTGTQKIYIVRLTTRLGHSEQKVISSY